jgi:hypothetical protein
MPKITEPTYKEHLEQKARQWAEQNKAEALLFQGWDSLIAREWQSQYAERKGGISPVAKDFIEASGAVGQEERDALYRTRLYCGRCGYTYKYENGSMCVMCLDFLCYRCSESYDCRRCGAECV